MLLSKISFVLLPIVLAGLLAGCNPAATSVQAPKAAPPPPKVTVAEPVKRLVAQEDEYVGRFVAVDTVEVRARVSGYLDAINFRDGEMVEKGAPLFTIDERTFKITLDQARANLEQAKANLALADNDLARAKDLVLGSTITRQTFDQRTAARRAALAAVMSQTAAVRQAELDVEFTQLKAPAAGRIGDRRTSVGNFVTAATGANATLLATIQSIDPIRFEFSLDEAAYLRLQRGTGGKAARNGGIAVKLRLLDEASFVHDGRIDFIDNAMSRTTGTIRGRAVIANPKGLFVPGLFARVRVAMSEPTEAILVPDSAIGSEQVRKFVLVLGADNIAKPKYVELGEVVDGLRVIVKGLDAGDRVVIDGLMRVRAGMKVEPVAGRIAINATGRPAVQID